MTEGYIKYNCEWNNSKVEIDDEIYFELEKQRAKLYNLGLIGVYQDGIGFGNISVRIKDNNFLITGSATGEFTTLEKEHYSLVNNYDIIGNSLSCSGIIKASAESLTHAAIYEAVSEVGSVVHVHSLNLWEKLLNKYPSTPEKIEYGTPQMAIEVGILANKIKDNELKIIVMGGHKEGIISFGNNIEDATNNIIELYKKHVNE